MLVSHFSASLAFLSTTAALPTSPWATQLVSQNVQKPLMEEPLLSAPAASSLEEIPSTVAASSPISLLYEFDEFNEFNEKVSLENVAARSNGHLLLTDTHQANLYSFDPQQQTKSHPWLLKTFPNATSALGIVEAAPDVFIVAVGNYSGLTGVNGSFSVWSVDFNNYCPENYHNLNQKHKKPTIRKITDIPEALALNGMTTITRSPNLVLIADSSLGAIWSVDIERGSYSMVIKHNLFAGTSQFPLGINGIRTYDDQIYFTNSAQRLYGRIPINERCSATAAPEIIARPLPDMEAWDDLAMDWEGNGWIATHAHAVTQVTVGGRQRSFFACSDCDELAIQRPTSLVFGRTSQRARRTLYVVTSGGKGQGQIFALDTRLI